MEEKTATLTADQQEAAALIEAWYYHLNTQIFVLCGYAGTGKTFLVDYVVRALGLVAGESAAFVAPTGKAASVLIQSGVPATTVHSLIYTREEDIEVDENGEVISEQFLRFVKKESIDSKIKLIVLDETSMVSDDVLRDLLSFGVKCLCCGDPAQLPPVGGSNTLLSTPVITLKEIVRQERDNPIVRLAARVRAGERPAYGEDGCVSVIPRRALDADARRALFTQADQIIVGTNRTRSMINREVRAIRGISPDRVLPQDGEKIICTLNDWSKPLDERGNFHLVNGIIGRCYRVREQLDGLGQLDFQPDFLAERVEDHGYEEAENLLSGRNPIREALKSGRDIEQLLVARGELSGSAREIVQMARERRVPVKEVDRARLDAITRNHQGMLAFASAYRYSTVEDMLDLARERGEAPFLILLDIDLQGLTCLPEPRDDPAAVFCGTDIHDFAPFHRN